MLQRRKQPELPFPAARSAGKPDKATKPRRPAVTKIQCRHCWRKFPSWSIDGHTLQCEALR